MDSERLQLRPIGRVESELEDPATAPKQGDEGAPEAAIVVDHAFVAALDGLAPGDEAIVLTWLDRADREVLTVHPRGDALRPQQGVFATRSPHRPNPIGLHRVRILAIEGNLLRVADLEALHGTPVLDLKPVLSADSEER